MHWNTFLPECKKSVPVKESPKNMDFGKINFDPLSEFRTCIMYGKTIRK